MIWLRQTLAVASLSACLFVLNVWLPAQVAGHAAHHSHHTAGTHADPLCTLLCSAGHAAHAGLFVVWQDAVPVDRLEPGVYRCPPTPRSNIPFSRGPPAWREPAPTVQT